jgi:hypothetical protein
MFSCARNTDSNQLRGVEQFEFDSIPMHTGSTHTSISTPDAKRENTPGARRSLSGVEMRMLHPG